MGIYVKNTSVIKEKLRKGEINSIDFPLTTFADEVIKKMYNLGIIEEVIKNFPDKRKNNKSIGIEAILVLSICAKLQRLCAVTDITMATTDIKILEKLGFSLVTEGDILSEGEIRAFVNKYESDELIDIFNNIAKIIIEKMKYNERKNIHQLDASFLEVNIKNERYENSEITKGKDNKNIRAYKLTCSRLMLDVGGIIERIDMCKATTHDSEAARKILETPYHMKREDILAYDRGYINRKIINNLKIEQGISIIIPAKKNMDIFKRAKKVAIEKDIWKKHPNSKRKGQEIAFVEGLGGYWTCEENETKRIEKEKKEDVELNACVIRIPKDDKTNIDNEIIEKDKKYKYIVLLSSECKLSASQIVRYYETRPEIEEDFRQLKDVWGLNNFKSTKYKFIVYHIITMLLGYMFYSIYKNTEDGEKYKNKNIITITNMYNKDLMRKGIPVKKLLIYSNKVFGIIDFTDFLDIYSDSTGNVREKIKNIIKQPIF